MQQPSSEVTVNSICHSRKENEKNTNKHSLLGNLILVEMNNLEKIKSMEVISRMYSGK